ncbi:replication protein RepA [Agarivorans sp. QJM3NY_25]|uniref:replication protein RepA n=1 Tax=Agarivorans sp. QJM3NY_25 TaxID=3421430 RepID=UPI003D7CB8E3
MSLTDLKKQPHRRRQAKKISVEQFIDDAENYALGKPSLNPKKAPADKPSTTFRHCTFTFDASAINQLQYASQQHQLAKSKLLRVLLSHFTSLNDEQQQQLLKLFNHN